MIKPAQKAKPTMKYLKMALARKIKRLRLRAQYETNLEVRRKITRLCDLVESTIINKN
jgi:hypothetical protein